MNSTKTQMLIGGRYELDHEIGKGGFGVVYRARDTLLHRDVAVKLLRLPTGSSPDDAIALQKRFLHEASTAGRISHPNIVTIHDMGVPHEGDQSSHAFIVMEYLQGLDLYKHLRSAGPYDPATGLARFVPLVLGIGKGHEKGVVHKDIKPGNIFVRDPGTPNESFCLLDFGIARLLHENKMTTTGMLVGTPHYMAPEYISQNAVSPALDVYQLALILVELLTGKPAVPHSETFMECCNRHFSGRLEIPSALTEGSFGAVLTKALSTTPDRRYPDATTFGEALAEVDPLLIPDEYRTTKAITAVFADEWVNPFDQTLHGDTPTLDGVPSLWEPEEIDPLAFTELSFVGPITSGGIVPTTDELKNTYSGNTQKGLSAPPVSGVHATPIRRGLNVFILISILIAICVWFAAQLGLF